MDDSLRQAALRVRDHAYVPYSGFAVGAVVVMDDGSRFTGANVENAAYPQTICAERSALVAAVSAGYRRLRRAYIVSDGGATPCGGCRSVMAEFSTRDTVVTCADLEGNERTFTMGELLPHAFEMSA